LTGYTTDYECGQWDEDGRQDYCQRHGYTYLCRHDPDPLRPPHWGKIQWLLEYLPAYDWICWLDADTLIERPETRLESFIEAAGEKDIAIAFDRDVWVFNTGVFLVRHNPWVLDFLQRVWNREDLIFANWFDQAAFNAEIDVAHVHEVEQWKLNAFSAMPCGFVRHFPGPYKKEYFAARRKQIKGK
jgi:hypothetical protein